MRFIPVFVIFLIASGCTLSPDSDKGNPPARGFKNENSDPAAVELADSIMAAMGGRSNWDKSRFFSWDFFGVRYFYWDKHKERVRIESKPDNAIYLLNLKTNEGKVSVNGREITDRDSLSLRSIEARRFWINDSYWLFMPFKLKDAGATIKYLGEDISLKGERCNVIELKHDQRGAQHKYLIFVDLKDNLVKQWAFLNDLSQDSAVFIRPWDNYNKYGKIFLSSARSDGAGPNDVKVYDHLPDTIFTQF